MALKECSPGAVSVILDFAFCTFETAQLADFPLCLQVWKAAHRFQIDGLSEEPCIFATKNVPLQYMVPFVRHAEVYGADAVLTHAYLALADRFVETAEDCHAFGELTCSQMLPTVFSSFLVATEDELLCVFLKSGGNESRCSTG